MVVYPSFVFLTIKHRDCVLNIWCGECPFLHIVWFTSHNLSSIVFQHSLPTLELSGIQMPLAIFKGIQVNISDKLVQWAGV